MTMGLLGPPLLPWFRDGSHSDMWVLALMYVYQFSSLIMGLLTRVLAIPVGQIEQLLQ